jgi:pyruvate kinase
MLRAKIVDGQPLRDWDKQPLKTKIVATIGSPQSYEEGIYNLKLEKDEPPYSYDYLAENFMLNGVSVIRLNMAYMTGSTTRSFFESLRRCLTEIPTRKRPRIAVLTDLPGPRIRFENILEGGLVLQKDKMFTIRFDTLVDGNVHGASVCINKQPLKRYNPDAFQHMMEQIEEKERGEALVKVGDGKVIMEVESVDSEDGKIECKVIKGGAIHNDRFTVKDVDFTIPSFTDEDQRKLNELFDSGAFQDDGLWAFVGLSFTQSAADVLRAKKFIEDKIKERGADEEHASWYAPALIAKIETSKGYNNREEILTVADGIMVARGDLGVQKDIEEIGTMEKELIKLCNKRGKPVITATQMLLSMVKSLEPTRAEVTDVFNSILDGTDAVMLSEETSTGCYPFHAIRKMVFIAAEAEHFYEKVENGKPDRRAAMRRYLQFLAHAEERIEQMEAHINSKREQLDEEIVPLRQKKMLSDEENERLTTLNWQRTSYDKELDKLLKQKPRMADCTSQAACVFSENEGTNAIIALTTTGRTARLISRFRPTVKIIGATHDNHNACKLLLSYGIIPINFGDVDSGSGPGEMFKKAGQVAVNEGLVRPKEGVVLTSGNRPKEPGTTNTVQMQAELSSVL